MNSLQLIETLSNANGACGFEDEVVTIAEKYVHKENLGSVRHDCNLNVYINEGDGTHKKPVVMLDAHSDEVCFIVQESVRAGGGTNGGIIHVANGGIPCIVIGVPVRYAHSHYGFASMEDYNNAVKLAVEIVRRLNKEQIEKF